MTPDLQCSALPERLTETRLETSPAKTARYAALTADFNPIHVDPVFARNTPFGAPINHGTLGLSLLTQSIEMTFGNQPYDLDIRFSRPAPVGSSLIAGGALRGADNSYQVNVTTGDGVQVIQGTLHLISPSNNEQGRDLNDRD